MIDPDLITDPAAREIIRQLLHRVELLEMELAGEPMTSEADQPDDSF